MSRRSRRMSRNHYSKPSQKPKSIIATIFRYALLMALARWAIEATLSMTALVGLWWYFFGAESILGLPGLMIDRCLILPERIKSLLDLLR